MFGNRGTTSEETGNPSALLWIIALKLQTNQMVKYLTLKYNKDAMHEVDLSKKVIANQ